MDEHALCEILRDRLPERDLAFYLSLWRCAMDQNLTEADAVWLRAELWKVERRYELWAGSG